MRDFSHTCFVARAVGTSSSVISGDGSGVMSGRDINQGMLLCRADDRAGVTDAVREMTHRYSPALTHNKTDVDIARNTRHQVRRQCSAY